MLRQTSLRMRGFRGSLIRNQSQPVAAFVQFAAELANAAVCWNIDDFDKLSACNLEAPARSDVFRVAGNPDRIDAESARKRHEQDQGTRGIVMAAMCAMNAVTDMTCVPLEVRV